VVGYAPLSGMSDVQRREFQEALLHADSFEDLPEKWQTAILNAEQNRPHLRSCDQQLIRQAGRLSRPVAVAASRGF
jgi:hypothetical protein